MNYDARIAELEAEGGKLEAQLEPLFRHSQDVRHELCRLRSLRFIEVNGIKRSDVELSSGKGKPWFGIIKEFAEWLRTNSTKDWAEWNSAIYRTSDLLRGKMPTPIAFVDDLPKEEK